MYDEETNGDDQTTLIRSPSWRNAALNKLTAKLDQ